MLKNYNPYITALTRNTLSKPLKVLLDSNLLNGDILDFGCGKGTDGALLRDLYELNTYRYDKYNSIFLNPKLLERKYDVAYSIYVFNVIADLNEFYEALNTLMKLSHNVYIAVRCDKKSIKPSWDYDKELEGYWTNKSFQRFFTVEMVEKYFHKVQIIRTDSSFILFKLKE